MNKLESLIAKHEGLRLLPYKDSMGKLTIGYGHNLEDNPISVEIADMLLNSDVKDAVLFCQIFEWFENLDEARQAVIVSMVFNLGLRGFMDFKKTIKLLEKGEYLKAGTEMLDSKWSRQVGSRSFELSRMMTTGKWK